MGFALLLNTFNQWGDFFPYVELFMSTSTVTEGLDVVLTYLSSNPFVLPGKLSRK